MEGVRAPDRVRAPFGHHVGDPVRRIRRHLRDRARALGAEQVEEPPQRLPCPARARPTPAAGCHGRPRPSYTGGPSCKRSHRSRSAAARPTGPPRPASRSRPGSRSLPPCATRSASTSSPRSSNTPPPATPPGHRRTGCARRRAAPTAPPPPTTPCSGQLTRGASASNTACTVPTSSDRHRRRPSPRSSPGSAAGTPRSGAAAPAPAAHERPAAPAPRRTRPARQRSSRPPATQPIPCALRTPFPAFDRSQPW